MSRKCRSSSGRLRKQILCFIPFLSESGGQPAGELGYREVFSNGAWVRETDGACQPVVCGFIQIYDGRKVKLRGAGLQCGALKGKKSPDEGRLPAQWCCCLNWLPFILAHCSGLLSAEGGVLGFTLNSIPSSLDPELSVRLLDWRLLKILPAKGDLFYEPLMWLPLFLHRYWQCGTDHTVSRHSRGWASWIISKSLFIKITEQCKEGKWAQSRKRNWKNELIKR